MNLYLANGRYVGTQAEARKLDKSFTEEGVPTDKNGLIAYLNELKDLAKTRVPSSAAMPHSRDMGATAVLSRSDNPDVDVDRIVETIGGASGYALRRYAGAVAVAFQNLAGD